MNCLWQPCSLTDRDEKSNLYRGPPHRYFLLSIGPFGSAVSGEKIKREKLTDNSKVSLKIKICNFSLLGPFYVKNGNS